MHTTKSRNCTKGNKKQNYPTTQRASRKQTLDFFLQQTACYSLNKMPLLANTVKQVQTAIMYMQGTQGM